MLIPGLLPVAFMTLTSAAILFLLSALLPQSGFLGFTWQQLGFYVLILAI
jgi:hypothetical protein